MEGNSMSDLIRFVGDFIDSTFGGWQGRLSFISLGSALILLSLWGLERSWVPRAILADYDMFDPWRWWNSILSLAAISVPVFDQASKEKALTILPLAIMTLTGSDKF